MLKCAFEPHCSKGTHSVSSHSLLVVDADPSVQDLVAGLLRRADRQIERAEDSREALERLRAAPCDLVLAGQGRNGFDGLRLLRQARAIRPELKVILTGEPDPERVVRAIRAQAFSYFHKPLQEGLLSDMVQQALDTSAWRDDIRVISAVPEWITLDIRSKMEAAERTTQFLREVQAELKPRTREDVAVAFRELLLNAIEHGAKCDPRKRVRVSLVRLPRELIMHVHDPGKGFSFDLLPHAAISNPEDSPIRHAEVRLESGQRPGGFGILLTRNLVDELVYNERGNAVLFVKYLK